MHGSAVAKGRRGFEIERAGVAKGGCRFEIERVNTAMLRRLL